MKVSCILRGGLGNCMFTAAATISYSLKHNIDYCLPSEVQNPHYDNQKAFYSPHLRYCNNGILTATVYREPSFEYTEIPPPTSNFTLLDGYFQSFRYVEPYREEVLRLFDIPYEFKEGWCSIHVRRGDYNKYPTMHPVLPIEYFNTAQFIMVKNNIRKFLIVSDDIKWCEDNLTRFKAEYVFSKDKTDVEDLSLASSCEHSIGSNSSFSVWVYWLNQNKNKIGVFPSKDKWFGKDLKHNVDDLYMPEWVLI